MSELRNRKPQSDTDEEKYNSEEEFDDSSSWKQYSEKESMGPLSHVLCIPNPSRNPLDTQSQKSDLWPRIKSALILAISFIFICYQGLRPTVLLVNVLQFCLFKELLDVRYVSAVEKQVPYFRTLHWGWFAAAMYYTYGVQIMKLFLPEIPHLEILIQYHNLICTGLYSFNFILFVLSLKKGCLKYQISQIAWTLLNIVLVVMQTSSMITNMSEGMLWFFFPVLLVCINDTCAYIFGKLFGKKFIKRPFTSLSPKKSWEGFIGGGLCTLLCGFYAPHLFKYIPKWYCPYNHYDCDLPAFLVPTEYTIPTWGWISKKIIVTLLPLQIHGLILALFASVVSPFGGLFASAIKRAYGKKDFNNIIPGHGGLMDRLDCQLIMIMFTGVYYSTFVKVPEDLLGEVLDMIAQLSIEDQRRLLNYLSSIVEK